MKKIALLSVSVLIIIMISVFFVSLLSSLKKSNTSPFTPNFGPTPTPIPQTGGYWQQQQSPLSLQKVTPGDTSTNVALNQSLTLTFNKPIPQNAVDFSIVPKINFTKNIQSNILTITPQEPYLSNTTYTYFVTIYGLPTYTLTFSTIQDPTVTTSPDFAVDIQDEINKHNHTDVFLSAYTPYDGNSFLLTSSYSSVAQTNVFTVTYYTDKQTAQNDFIKWATSLGLTKQQIAFLQITYRQATPGF